MEFYNGPNFKATSVYMACVLNQILVFKTLKALLYKLDEDRFYKELSSVTNQLKSDEDTADFCQYFITPHICQE